MILPDTSLCTNTGKKSKCTQHRKQVLPFISLPPTQTHGRVNWEPNLYLDWRCSRVELDCFISSRVYGLSIYTHTYTHTMGRGKTANVKHPLWNQDMVTRKCLAPNSSIYWIPVNIPGSATLTKPRLGLTSAADQQRREKTPVFLLPLPFVHQSHHWETQCLFEVVLYSELLHGNTFGISLQPAEAVAQRIMKNMTPPPPFFVTITGNSWHECKTHARTHTDFSLSVWLSICYSFSDAWPKAGPKPQNFFF